MKRRLIVFLQLMPVIISMLLIGAHFLRARIVVLVVISLILLGCLVIRHSLIPKLMQLALVLSTAEWIRVVIKLASARAHAELPWQRLAIIIGAVASLSFASIFVFYSKTLKQRYKLTEEN